MPVYFLYNRLFLVADLQLGFASTFNVEKNLLKRFHKKISCIIFAF